MKDRSRLVTLAALVALVVAVTSLDSGMPSLDAVSETLFWILGGFLIFHLIRGGACCGSRCEPAAEEAEE